MAAPKSAPPVKPTSAPSTHRGPMPQPKPTGPRMPAMDETIHGPASMPPMRGQ